MCSHDIEQLQQKAGDTKQYVDIGDVVQRLYPANQHDLAFLVDA